MVDSQEWLSRLVISAGLGETAVFSWAKTIPPKTNLHHIKSKARNAVGFMGLMLVMDGKLRKRLQPFHEAGGQMEEKWIVIDNGYC